MRTTVFLMAALAALYVNSASAASTKALAASELPVKGQTFLSNHFVSTSVSKATFAKWEEYDVQMSDGSQIVLDRRGDWRCVNSKKNPLPQSVVDLLPKSVAKYVAKTYPYTDMVKVKKERWGYAVTLSTRVELEFDTEGNFRRADD